MFPSPREKVDGLVMVTEDIVGKSNIYESGLIKYHLSIFVFFLILNKTLC